MTNTINYQHTDLPAELLEEIYTKLKNGGSHLYTLEKGDALYHMIAMENESNDVKYFIWKLEKETKPTLYSVSLKLDPKCWQASRIDNIEKLSLALSLENISVIGRNFNFPIEFETSLFYHRYELAQALVAGCLSNGFDTYRFEDTIFHFTKDDKGRLSLYSIWQNRLDKWFLKTKIFFNGHTLVSLYKEKPFRIFSSEMNSYLNNEIIENDEPDVQQIIGVDNIEIPSIILSKRKNLANVGTKLSSFLPVYEPERRILFEYFQDGKYITNEEKLSIGKTIGQFQLKKDQWVVATQLNFFKKNYNSEELVLLEQDKQLDEKIVKFVSLRIIKEQKF